MDIAHERRKAADKKNASLADLGQPYDPTIYQDGDPMKILVSEKMTEWLTPTIAGNTPNQRR